MSRNIFSDLLEAVIANQESIVVKAARNVLSYELPLEPDKIKARFRDLAKFHHPDVAIHNGVSETDANEKIKLLLKARDILLENC